jgi:hypothetical protein
MKNYETGSVFAQKSEKTEDIDMFRPSPMSLIQIYIPSEASHSTIAELGKLEIVQFRDVLY